jgi:hypothetical protein
MTPIEATALNATKLLREKSAMQSERRADTQLATKGVLVAAGHQWRKPLKGMALSRVMANICRGKTMGFVEIGRRRVGDEMDVCKACLKRPKTNT